MEDEKNNKDKSNIKKRFIIEVQGIAPVTVQLETWAYNEEEALNQLDNPSLMSFRQKPDIDITRLRRQKVTVKDALTSLIKIVKNF